MRAKIARGLAGASMRRLEDVVRADRAYEDRCALVLAEQRAAREHVAEATRAGGITDEEVPGHPDPDGIDADATRDLDHHHRKRDRDAQPAFEHRVEQRVGGIVVALDVAAESLDDEQVVANAVEARAPARGGDVVEPARPEPEIERGMHVRGDEERGLVERRLDC